MADIPHVIGILHNCIMTPLNGLKEMQRLLYIYGIGGSLSNKNTRIRIEGGLGTKQQLLDHFAFRPLCM